MPRSGLLATGSMAACGDDSDDTGTGGGERRPARSASSCRTPRARPAGSTDDLKFLKAAFEAAGVDADIQNAQGDKSPFQTIADGMIPAASRS